MFKKLLLGCVILVGLIYGSGNDFSSIKRTVLGASNDNARGFTGGSNDGWGSDSGY